VVLEAAARFLGVRARSEAEVRRRLTRAGYAAHLVDGAIVRMTELGVLDDEAFARAWVASRDRARPRGERALRDELRLKGVERETVDRVLADRYEEATADTQTDPDRVAAERLIQKHARALARIDDPRKRRGQAYALLARSGFDATICHDVASGMVESGKADDSDPDA
jgi:regulatory protein